MSGHKWIEFLKHLNVISPCVPARILLVSVIFPGQPTAQQALVVF
jgi:hypothetical protein